jgi:hypothetical protein
MELGHLIVLSVIGSSGHGLSRLNHPLVGFGFAMRGAIIGGGLTLAAGVFLKYLYTTPRNRNDSDLSGFRVTMLCIFILPTFFRVIGFALGIGHAVRRERWVAVKSPDKADPLDF